MSFRVRQLQKVQDEGRELFARKNIDYGDAFARYGPVGVLVRLGDKISRAQSITKDGVTLVDNEGLRDTLIDLHNYSAMAIMLLDEDNSVPDESVPDESVPDESVPDESVLDEQWTLHIDQCILEDVMHSHSTKSLPDSIESIAAGIHQIVCNGLLPLNTCTVLVTSVLETHYDENMGCSQLAKALQLAANGVDVSDLDNAVRNGEIFA